MVDKDPDGEALLPHSGPLVRILADKKDLGTVGIGKEGFAQLS